MLFVVCILYAVGLEAVSSSIYALVFLCSKTTRSSCIFGWQLCEPFDMLGWQLCETSEQPRCDTGCPNSRITVMEPNLCLQKKQIVVLHCQRSNVMRYVVRTKLSASLAGVGATCASVHSTYPSY
jgi:hypothetical protein